MNRSETQTRKELDGLIAEFNKTRKALIEAASAVPAELRDVAFVGSWDLKDVIAHTVGWDYTNVEALPDFAAGRLPAFFGRYDAGWASINTELVARYRVEDWDALMRSLADAQQAFVTAMAPVSDADLDKVVPWKGRRVSLRGMLRAISRDEAEHVRQIQAFAQEHAS